MHVIMLCSTVCLYCKGWRDLEFNESLSKYYLYFNNVISNNYIY